MILYNDLKDSNGRYGIIQYRGVLYMHNFSYVSKKEAAPYKNEIISLLKLVQKEVKEYFTFRFDFVGSSSRNMITCERNGNIGYDFYVNIEPNDPEEKYPASNIRRFIFDAIQKHMGKYGYAKIENSTSVITIKAIDRDNRRIEHSCDFAMPTDFPRPQEQSYAGTMLGYQFNEELSSGIKKLVKKTGATEYMVFLAAAMVMLSKYSRQEDIVIGSPISGRTHRDTEGMLGMFVNTLAMRGKPEKNKTFAQFLEEIKNTCLKAYENQEYPFEELVEAVDVQRDMSRNPLFDVMLAVQNNEETKFMLGNCEAEEIIENGSIAKFDMTFNITDYDGKFGIILEYCTDLFRAETADEILKHFEEVLRTVTKNADQKLGEIEMVTSAERELILNDFNATETDYPRDKTVVELFEEQVKKTPDNIALVFEDKKMTYTEFNARANSLAHKLRELGVKPNDFVAIIADKSIEIIEGIYGIIKAGGAYLPIDPTYPEDRIAFMLEDSAAKIVLKFTDEPLNIPEDLTVIDLADEAVWNDNNSDPETVNKPEDAIYCIYTSGTTGKPKGVVVEHHNVVKLVKNCDYTELNEESIILQTGQLMFDASTFEVWGAALNGGTLHLISKENMLNAETFKKYLVENKVNTLFITTALFNQFVGEDKTIFNSLKHLMFGGEATSERHVEMLRSQNTDVDFRNVYGPTETTTFAAHYIIKNIRLIYALSRSFSLPINSSSLPLYMSCPSRRTAIFSQVFSTSSTICVERITTRSLAISESIFLKRTLSSGSSPAVGSSTIRTLGSPISA